MVRVIRSYTSTDVRDAEAPLLATETGYAGGLMERAAFALALRVVAQLRARRRGGRVREARVVVLVGAGNNGGDALYASASLVRRGVEVRAILVTGDAHPGGLAALRRAGGRVAVLAGDPTGALPALDLPDAVAEAWTCDVLLDAVTGIGVRGALRGRGGDLIAVLSGLREDFPDDPAAPTVIAVDVPSGIGTDDGTVPGPVLRADRTVTFGALKPGLLLPPAALLAGEVELVDLGLELSASRPAVERLEAGEIARCWPVPRTSAQKYSRGVLGVVAGSAGFPGAAVLACDAAVAAGVGMVRYLGPEAVAGAVRASRPEVVVGPGRVQAWVIGSGIDAASEPERLRAAIAEAVRTGLPTVLDAGALELVGSWEDRLPASVLLTPHSGELASLLAARGEDVSRLEVEAEPLRWARRAQHLTGASVLHKGAVTVVVGPSETFAQAEAPAWLATAGAGDVLAGVLGALLAGRSDEVRGDPGLVVRLGAVAASITGRAAHAANPGGPVAARDVARAVPGAVAAVLRGER